jgi:hypothetical protein
MAAVTKGQGVFGYRSSKKQYADNEQQNLIKAGQQSHSVEVYIHAIENAYFGAAAGNMVVGFGVPL